MHAEARAFAMAESAASGGPPGLLLRYDPASWVSLTLGGALLPTHDTVAAAPQSYATAGATVRNRVWSASLFVNYLGPRASVDDESVRLRSYSTVGAQLAGRLSRNTRVSFDVFNVFDRRVMEVEHFEASQLWKRPPGAQNFLFNPAERRGFRLMLRTTF